MRMVDESLVLTSDFRFFSQSQVDSFARFPNGLRRSILNHKSKAPLLICIFFFGVLRPFDTSQAFSDAVN